MLCTCTSGFIDDVIFAGRTGSLGLGYKLCAVIPVAGQRAHTTTFRALKVTSQMAPPRAESAVYDCLALGCIACIAQMRPTASTVAHVAVSVCLLGSPVSPTKADEPIEMPFVSILALVRRTKH